MDSLPINALDLIVFAVLLISALLAFSRGLVHEVLSVGAWVGATFVTLYGFVPAKSLALQFIPHEFAAETAAGVGLFLISLVFFSLLSKALSRRVQDSSLGALDSTLGLIFGLLRGAIIICLVWLASNAWLLPAAEHPAWMQEAKTRPLIVAGADTLITLVPSDLRMQSSNAVESALQKGDKALETGRVVQELLQPKAAPAPQSSTKDGAPEEESGYTEGQRGQLNQAIEALQ
ncbi:CvpA family protein [Rhodovibrionaceae bacterium A322]